MLCLSFSWHRAGQRRTHGTNKPEGWRSSLPTSWMQLELNTFNSIMICIYTIYILYIKINHYETIYLKLQDALGYSNISSLNPAEPRGRSRCRTTSRPSGGHLCKIKEVVITCKLLWSETLAQKTVIQRVFDRQDSECQHCPSSSRGTRAPAGVDGTMEAHLKENL